MGDAIVWGWGDLGKRGRGGINDPRVVLKHQQIVGVGCGCYHTLLLSGIAASLSLVLLTSCRWCRERPGIQLRMGCLRPIGPRHRARCKSASYRDSSQTQACSAGGLMPPPSAPADLSCRSPVVTTTPPAYRMMVCCTPGGVAKTANWGTEI